jgi:drug/metabolite transporter (DMT)-like permease
MQRAHPGCPATRLTARCRTGYAIGMQKATAELVPPTDRAARPSPPASRDRLRAIGLMMIAVAMFACLDCTAKYIVTRSNIPLVQAVWMRFFGQFAFTVLALGLVSLPRLFASKRPGTQLVRSILLVSSTLLNFVALQTLRLDQTLTIQFMAPLMVALLAGPLLGEWVGWRRMLAIITGFIGILVVIRPGFDTTPPGVPFALGCMLCYTLFILITRHVSAHDSAEVTLTYSMLGGVVLAAPFAYLHWTWPADVMTWTLVISMGFWAAVGHFVFILAYRLAPASTVAPFLYTQLLSMTILGFAVFGDIPDQWTLVGSAIVIASGIYLVHRETVKQAPGSLPTQ